MKTRGLWVIAHRWAGLTIALFLMVAGLTGSLLAFNEELDAMAAPALHLVAPPRAGAAILDPQVLRDRVMGHYPGGVVEYLPLRFAAGKSVTLEVERIDPKTGKLEPWSDRWNELFVDPYTGATLGQRRAGDLTEGVVNIMPFLYRLHQSLALGAWGQFALGIAALIWTVDCFIGFYLTLPVGHDQGARASRKRRGMIWSRWQPAWLVRWRGGRHRLTFDLHRAGGLWLWPLLLVFAWSGVSFNLSAVYNPTMRLFGYRTLQDGIVPPAEPRYHPKLDFRAAETVGYRMAQREAARSGVTIDRTRMSGLLHRPDAGLYAFIFSSSADIRREGGRSLVLFDSDTGRHLKTVIPVNANGANALTEWITAIHMASVWGMPWRIATAILGCAVTMLSVTGVLLWTRKRMARRTSRGRRA